jgi:hypothetical protein
MIASGIVGRGGEVATEVDTLFVGMNLRNDPSQLLEGEVCLSKNGRMDGFWQPRKGVLLRSGSLGGGETPLRLPFFLVDTAGGKTISAASRVDDLVTLTVTSHGLTVGLTGYLGVENVGFASVSPNGRFVVTVVDANTLEYTIDGATGNETYTISGDEVVRSVLNDSAIAAVLGSCHFSDPRNDLDESIFLSTPLDVKKVSLDTFVTTSLSYPTGYTASGAVDMIQANDKVYLFRDGIGALEYVPNGRIIDAASLTTNLVTVTVKQHGLATGDSVTLSGLTYSGTNPNGLRTVTAVTVDTFTFALTSANETYGVTNGKMVASGFTYCARGSYTQPQTFAVTSANVSVTGGLLTMTVVGNTTIRKGDFVTVYKSEIVALESAVGKSFEVVTATPTQIQFYVPSGNVSAAGSLLFEVGGRFSVGGGFIHMPAPPWAVYFQRRLWCPYWYEPNGSYGAYTYRDLEQRDQIVASDILDGDTYDQIYSQFRITAGTADYVVAMQPFYDDRLMVLNRNSLHVIVGTQGSLEDTVVKELTREVGCLARKSVVGYGNAVFFLSDNGIYGVEFQDEYNLRGIQEPLSLKIQPLIDRVNKTLASNAVGTYFNNRYWLALPLDSKVGANDAAGNNTVLVYNILNKGWESIDTYGNGNLRVLNYHIAQDGARNNLFLISPSGGLHQVDAREQPADVYSINTLSESTSAGIDYELVTRGYTFGSVARKRFSRAQALIQSNDEPANVLFSFETEDPDSAEYELGDIQDALGSILPSNEAGTMRFRLGNPRGIYGRLTISADTSGSTPIGRPKVISIGVEGQVHNRQTISQV